MTRKEIKETYTMRDILCRYNLKPNRAGFIHCPFHRGDHQASLKVYDRDYHCFACGANGDIFTFVQKMSHVTFKEAYLELGGEYRSSNNKSSAIRIAQLKRQREDAQKKESAFQTWKKDKIEEVCRLLSLYDALDGRYNPYTEQWCRFVEGRQNAEYWYQILALGTREEQEAMRREYG